MLAFQLDIVFLTLVNIDGITLGLDIGTKLLSLDGPFYVSNDDKL